MMRRLTVQAHRCRLAALVVAGTAAFGSGSILAASDDSPTQTPIKHLIVIFQENVSFDHNFATYPHAAPGSWGRVLP